MADAPDRFVGRIERDVADARMIEQQTRRAAIDINLHQIAEAVVVARIESLAGGGIVGERGGAIERRPLEIRELLFAAVLERKKADVAELTYRPEAGDQAVGLGIVKAARDRAQAALCHRLCGRQRV